MKSKMRILALLLIVSLLLSSFTAAVSAAETVTISQLSSSASSVEEQIKKAVQAGTKDENGVYYNVVAPTLTVDQLTMSVEDYVYVAAQAILAIEAGKAASTSFTVKDMALNTASAVGAKATSMTKNMLLDLANRISVYGETTGKMRNSFSRPEDGNTAYDGRVCLYSIAQAFAAALKNYNTAGKLPASVTFLPADYGVRINPQGPIEDPEIISDWYVNIIKCSQIVKNTVEGQKKLPDSLNFGGATISMAQYLYMALQAVINIKNGITTGALKVAAMGEAPGPSDSIASGQIQTAEFIDMANRTVSFMETNGHAPNYISTSLGQMHYYTGVYFFARILNYFGAYGQLPSQAKAEAWAITNGTYVEGSASFGNDYSGYANYLVPTANCQSTNATIISVAKTGMNYGSTPTSTYGAMYNLMNYLNDNIGYGYYYDTYYGAVGTWNNREGNCCDSAHLMNACARSLGVPGRYVHAYCRFTSGLETGHVWSEVLCGNEWYTADLVSDYNYLGYKTSTTLSLYNRYIELPF